MYEEVAFLTKKIVRKRASNGRQKLVDEINWLASLPAQIKAHFPEVLESHINDKDAYYVMPFYDIPTFRQAIFNEIINGEVACDILETIFDFMYNSFYSISRTEVPSDFIRKTHFERVLERTEQVRKKAEVFDRIIDKAYIVWNGKKYLNALTLIKSIGSEKNLIELLSPPWISQIHGDLHFDNILIEMDEGKELANFILIDPRGWAEGSDYVYDLGKLWHSFHGLYDFVHRGDFSIKLNEISKQEIEFDLQYKKKKILKEYNLILKKYPALLDQKYKLKQEDPFWDLRTLFTEGIHFLSLPDFHLKFDGKEEKAISLYITGVKLLNKVWEDYNKIKG